MMNSKGVMHAGGALVLAGCLALLPSLGHAAETGAKGAAKTKEWYMGHGKWAKKTEPQPVPDTLAKVSGDDIKAMLDQNKSFLLVDARNAAEFKDGHLPKAVNLYDKTLAAHKAKLPKDKNSDIVFYCNGYPACPRSLNAATMAVEWGYKKVSIYLAGFPEWSAKGFAVEH
jgi:rhodanese-related sulfurtransferase